MLWVIVGISGDEGELEVSHRLEPLDTLPSTPDEGLGEGWIHLAERQRVQVRKRRLARIGRASLVHVVVHWNPADATGDCRRATDEFGLLK